MIRPHGSEGDGCVCVVYVVFEAGESEQSTVWKPRSSLSWRRIAKRESIRDGGGSAGLGSRGCGDAKPRRLPG